MVKMIFYSKKNYGFISDGNLSIDNKLGIDINVKDNINIVTNDKDVVMVTGNGKIFLGSKDLEPLVKGKQLVTLLAELLLRNGIFMKYESQIQFCVKTMLKDLEREKIKLLEKLQGDYGDRFHSEGLEDYRRRREELDEIFTERMEKIHSDNNKGDL